MALHEMHHPRGGVFRGASDLNPRHSKRVSRVRHARWHGARQSSGAAFAANREVLVEMSLMAHCKEMFRGKLVCHRELSGSLEVTAEWRRVPTGPPIPVMLTTGVICLCFLLQCEHEIITAAMEYLV